ncbi:hypothetical protein A3A60_02165 [Candidatus Curtissbacteria bacterium RIFCSPLOWO2_01_FULL_42_26]|uniref:DUF541 domain-containing protein n=1 Tax=Candidatus Curtissbacteria bacterium RIFCSPLOWO2_01_FULL_42_26 TaxID=1797729 RepID=A0A1F5HYV0_9BACT|nr:MAG: hypothetical protein A3A60_02165 [Candidatus Curtissbacteria bacterium RIFCSPLOWO2_01_FULL_42_26]
MQKSAQSGFLLPSQTWLWPRQTWLWPVVVLAIAFGAFYFKPWQTKVAETISVSAEGKADAAPDISKITAIIESKNLNLDIAQTENEKKVSKVISTLQDLGIEEKDIKTQNISAVPGYEGQTLIYPVPPRPDTNQFSTTLEVTVRDFDKADQVISTLTQNGATNLYGPQLTLSDEKLEAAKSQAREKAVDNALAKARQLARASKRKVGKAVKITEQENFGYPQPLIAENSMDLKQKASQIQPGQNQVTVTISADYQLR